MDPLYTLEPEAVRVAHVADKPASIRYLAKICAECYGLDAGEVETRLLEREALGSTGFGNGVALPHARLSGLERPIAVVVRFEQPIDYDAADGLPVDIACALLSPEHDGAGHLHALAAFSRMMRNDRFRAKLVAAPNAEALYGLVSNEPDRDAA